MSIARTAATGGVDRGSDLLPELLAWSSSLDKDLNFWRCDVLGSLAHVTMLREQKIVPEGPARAIAQQLRALLARPEWPEGLREEDVHMAVEAFLTAELGPSAGHLHSARSRNDQVALDLRLFVREESRRLLEAVLALVRELSRRARSEEGLILPAYTHRQRAQPVSLAMYFGAWSSALLRAAQVLAAGIDTANVLPLGAGAVSGTSLPINRQRTKELLGFASVTQNALDTVGDRDFALDFVWAASRVHLALSRLGQDLVDFSSTEFGFVTLSGQIATGSSMMPQKKNPDVFELLRGKASAALGRVVHLFSLMRGLPTGYNRDLQEDRDAILVTAKEASAAVSIARAVIPHVAFDATRCLAALTPGFTQATDLAEAMVKGGTPFRDAYRSVGALVKRALDQGVSLDDLATRTLPEALARVLSPAAAVAAKESEGGTGPNAIQLQLASIESTLAALGEKLALVPSVDVLITQSELW